MEISSELFGNEALLQTPEKIETSEEIELGGGLYDPLIPRKLMEGLCGCGPNYLVRCEQEGLITPIKVKRGGLDVVVYRVADVKKVLDRRGTVFTKPGGAQVIAVFSQKGGTGKSAFAQQMGAMLSLVGRTLAIDLDSQGDLTNLFDGVRNPTELIEELDPTIAELMDWTLESGESLDYRKLTFDQVVKKISPSLDLIPAGLDLGEINYSLNRHKLSERSHADGSPKIPPELYMVKDVIDQVKGRYDFIILDMPPNIETLNIGALLAANRILIPLELEAKSILVIRRNEEFLNRIRDMHPGFQWEKILCVPNKYSKQSIKMKAYSTLVDMYSNRSDFALSEVTLPQSVIIDRSAQVREPVFALTTKRGKDWKSDVARAKEFTNYFWAITHEILDVPGEALVFPMMGLESEV